MKRPISITVHGKQKEWAFTFQGDPAHIPEWEADGLEVHEVLNSVPVWAVDLGLIRPWIAVQDAWRWLRIW